MGQLFAKRAAPPAIARTTTTAPSAAAASGAQTATFAAGCFWGVELHFQRLPGVLTTTVGYAQGHVQQPTYKQVCSGVTGHTEAVRLTFDPAVLSYGDLVEAFWSRKGFDMTQKNGQGNDWGTQYRSGTYTHDDEQARIAAESKAARENRGHKVAVEIEPALAFWPAEAYHQQYLQKGGQDASKGCTVRIRCYG